ncbi:hypothetical protein [Alloiococcus otitis]|uniref:hypothetical protein n=1 Tax=Alloiococcus otitis TaxID=1652 RepID=UPI0015F25A0A|nr:hypothetical protein [Alloiococcus otitis]
MPVKQSTVLRIVIFFMALVVLAFLIFPVHEGLVRASVLILIGATIVSEYFIRKEKKGD